MSGTAAASLDSRLFLLGNIPVDLTQRVPRLPVTGEDLRSEGEQVVAPGGAFHVLQASWRSGLRGRFAGSHGRGPFGDLVRAALAALECEVLQPVAVRDSAVVVVLVQDSGERTFVSPVDAMSPFGAGWLDLLHPGPADLVYVSGYSLGLGTASDPLAHWVGDLPRDYVVFCDLGPWGAAAPAETLAPVLGRVDWVACNAREAAVATGVSEPGAAAGALQRRTGSAGVLVRVGARGCWLAEPGTSPVLVAAREEQAVDSTGAGDAHSGAFLAALAERRSAPEAVEHANAVAARVVTSAAEGMGSQGFGSELGEED